MVRARKILIAERFPFPDMIDSALVEPSLFRILVEVDAIFECEEVYLDVDTVPDDLQIKAFEIFSEDVLFVYSGRWESEKRHIGGDEFFHALWYIPSDEVGHDAMLAYANAEGQVYNREWLYRNRLSKSGTFGCKGFYLDLIKSVNHRQKLEVRQWPRIALAASSEARLGWRPYDRKEP